MTTEPEAVDLEVVRGRADVATPGPWRTQDAHAGEHCYEYPVLAGNGWDSIAHGFSQESDADAQVVADMEFIAAARSDIPALVAEVERLRSENERLIEAADVAQIVADEGQEVLADVMAELAELREPIATAERRKQLLETVHQHMRRSFAADLRANRAEAERDALQRQVDAIREARRCLGAGPMDYEMFVDVVDAALVADSSGGDQR